MPEKTKRKGGPMPGEEKKNERSDWRDDQQRRRYYYDDAHGYEVYRPEDEEDESPDAGKIEN